MKEIKLVQGNKYIILTLTGCVVKTQWGKIGGKEQETSHTYGYINEGKKNELLPSEAALADLERKAEKKIKEGYQEVKEIVVQEDEEEKLNFDTPQTSFTLSKPITKISDKKLQKLMDDDHAIFNEKENGMCHWVITDSDANVRIFTRRMNDHTIKYPGIVKAFEDLLQPAKLRNSCFAVELVVDNPNHHTGFRLLQEISKSDTLRGECKEDQTKSLSLQEVNPVRGCVFYCLYANEFPVWKANCEVNAELIDRLLPPKRVEKTLFAPARPVFHTVEEVKTYIKFHEERLEGLVCWDKKAPVEVTFNGKPRRRAAYKIKVPREMDVIAWGWTEGTGYHQGNIGALQIGKYRDGKLLDYGRCGSGISDELMTPTLWTFPCVIEIEYEYHEPTGKFKFPRFSKIHEDKVPSDCEAEEGEAPNAVEVDLENLPKAINTTGQ